MVDMPQMIGEAGFCFHPQHEVDLALHKGGEAGLCVHPEHEVGLSLHESLTMIDELELRRLEAVPVRG